MASRREIGLGLRFVVAGGAGALLIGLGACTSATDLADPGATVGSIRTATAGSGSSTAAPSTTTSTAAPTTGTAGTGTYPTDVPAAARANTTEGAKEFVKYFLEQVRIAYTTPKAGLLPALSLPECKTCAAWEREAVNLASRQQRYDQPPLNVLEVAVDPEDQLATNGRMIGAGVHQNAARVLDATNNLIRTATPKDAVLVFTVRRVGADWAVAEVQVSS